MVCAGRTAAGRPAAVGTRFRLRSAGAAWVVAWGCAGGAVDPAAAWFTSFDIPSMRSVSTADASAAGQDTTSAVTALRLTDGQTIAVDGRLDDAVWARAQAASGFHCWDPQRGGAAYERTVFKVAYDDRSLYFGVACAESESGKVTGKLCRRDKIYGSDQIGIYLDPYHDHSSGYVFWVNPRGVQQDAYVVNDGEEESDWDTVWEAETFQDGDGWFAEVRIPFSSIRYRTESEAWGLDVFREIHAQGESDAWVVWDRDKAGFVSRFGHLAGISHIPAPRQLEVTPYVVYRADDPAVPGPESIDRSANTGADLKYGVTAALTLNATVQPDFGQVESDPAVLNLSPFETYYSERRPFFTEGGRYFEQPAFTSFYSRRVGTGSENSRIRTAAKLTGKTRRGTSIGTLLAITDVTGEGQTHNLFKDGTQQSSFLASRIGQEFAGGRYQFNVTQTVVARPGSRAQFGDLGSREAYTTGGDFELLFHDRVYALEGSYVGSVIDSEARPGDAAPQGTKTYGTGGFMSLNREGRSWNGSLSGRWITPKLDLNDAGYLQSTDRASAALWVGYRYNARNRTSLISSGNLNLNTNLTYCYARRAGYDLHTGEQVWSYGRGHRQIHTISANSWMRLRNLYEVWWGLSRQLEGTQRYDTRNTVLLQDGRRAQIPGGGPLICEPDTWTGWVGGQSDYRKNVQVNAEASYSVDRAHNLARSANLGLTWNQTSAIHHDLSAEVESRTDDTQHLENFENPGHGIGGVSYVYGQLRQKTLRATLRSSLLFSRNKSLEIYAEPYVTTGTYSGARELTRPDTYELAPYSAEGFDDRDYDFRFGSVNVNAVFRWEYRPGSTFFLVWTHTRSTYSERGWADDPTTFDTGINSDPLLRNEPENVLLAKITYWIPI